LEAVRARARTEKLSMWEAAQQLLAGQQLPRPPGTAEGRATQELLPTRAAASLAGFLQLIERLAQETAAMVLAEQVEHMLQHSSLIDHYRKEKGEKAESRIENLEELVNAARGYEHDPADGLDPLSAFLAHAALEAGEGQAEAWEDCVQLMSLHSAKGLEFPLVFLTGLEEGLFPHERSLTEPGRLEEERRLCYVGMTRARQRLVVTYAELRRLHGSEHYTSPSRFLGEIDPQLIREVRAAARHAAPSGLPNATPPASAGVRLGDRVRHAQFGEGVILKYEGQGSHARVHVNFEAVGAKWLVLAYANLQQLR
jgi:DNA helicase-2/ATP-dependent DNA helicase PcrA